MSALSDQGKRVWGLGRGPVWERFSTGASNQISLMKWAYGVHPDESEATASMPMLPGPPSLAVSLWLLTIS